MHLEERRSRMDLAVPDTAYTIVKDDAGIVGYSYGRPPGIEGARWPRSRCTGLPMEHLFTIRVPEQYRCTGRDLVGLSVFQADDHVAVRIPGAAEVLAGGESPTHDETAARYWAAVVRAHRW